MLESIFSTPIYVKNDVNFLPQTLKVFNDFGMENYYTPNMYGVSGFTTYFDQTAQEKIKEAIPDLLNFIKESAVVFLNEIGYDLSNYSVYVGSAWFSEMRENSSHAFHMHSALGNKTTVLSGTYYLSTPENCSPITFSRSEGEYFNQVALPVAKENSFARKFYSYQPNAGDLVLFLAETFHGVLANKSKVSRNTLSFNVNVKNNAD